MTYLEPLLGAVAAFLLGFAWYTALFGKAWQKATGITDEEAQGDMLRTHGLSFLMMVCIAFALNFVMSMHPIEDQTFVHGCFHGAGAALMFGVPLMAINLLYQKKPLSLFLIDAGYAIAFFALAGGVVSWLKF